MENDIDHPLVQYVFTLKNCDGKHRKTDFVTGHITNPDAIILLMYVLGPIGLSDIRNLSEQWKGPGNHSLATYFGPTQGYTGLAFEGKEIYHEGGLAGGGNRNAPPWYRSHPHVPGGPTYCNSLTVAGLQRAAELVAMLPERVKAAIKSE